MHSSCFSCVLPDEPSTQQFGTALGQALSPGLIIALNGSLGVGKTTLSRALLRSQGVTGTIKSPSYSWVETYNIPLYTLNHFDFYRFKEYEDWNAYGFDSYFDENSINLIEWPDKVKHLLPPIDLDLQLDYHDSGRRLTAYPLTSKGNVCLTKLIHALQNTSRH